MSKMPKNTARLFYIKRRVKTGLAFMPRWAKFRLANAMFIWIGPLEIGWRMPWAQAYRDLRAQSESKQS